MRDPSLRPVSKGDRPSADQQNRLSALANADITGVGAFGGRTWTALASPYIPTLLLPHRPDANVPANGVMVANSVEDATYAKTLLTTAPTGLGESPIYVNSEDSVSKGYLGSCLRPGAAPTLVAYETGDGTPAAGESWGPVPDSFLIRKGFPGFLCLAAGDGTNVLAVWQGDRPLYYANLDEELAQSGSASATFYSYSGGDYAESDVTDTVYCTYLSISEPVPAGNDVWCEWVSAARRLEAVSWACVTEEE